MQYHNPVLRGFYPDPSICRVEKDYYLVTSSFEYFPGIPIFHSRDLVNWRQIGNCINRPDQLSLENAKDSGGIWAPTIRYWKDTFYVTATLDHCGNFIVSTKDIQKGWSDPTWVPMGGIDPSLYFEGTKAYYCTNQSMHKGKEEISLAEIDITTGALKSDIKPIWSGTGSGFLEAPHIYHIGNWYYLMAAEGGTNFNHMVTISRSKNLWGEYEACPSNPILTNRHDTSKQVQCAGHGDLLEDHNGNWWMVHLGIRLSRRTMSHLGRETFLTPIKWQDEWPIVENNTMAKLENNGPLWEKQNNSSGWQADFNQTEWEPQWIFLRSPLESSYKRENGKLILSPTTIRFENQATPTFVGVRQPDFECHIETNYSFETEQIGDEAGLVIYLASNFYYCINKRRTAQGDFLIIEKVAEDFREIAYKEKIKAEKIHLSLCTDKEFYYFYYSINHQPLTFACKASTRFLSCEIVGKCFTGTILGIYAICHSSTKALAKFDNFSISVK